MLQKNKSSEQTKQRSRLLRKALTLGLATVVTTTAWGKETSEHSGNNNLGNNKEILPSKTDKTSQDCAYYLNNVVLDADSPIEQIYKVNKQKAFYSPYLNEGKGGIVFTKYHISDADLFANANKQNVKSLETTLKNFAESAKRFGYKDTMKTLDDVQKCLDFYASSDKKKDKHIKNILEQSGDESGLTAALNLKKTVAEMNEANLKTAKHEQIHASIGQFTKAINNGEVMLSPGGIYLTRMADELRAQIKGGNIEATEQGLEGFFADFGRGYKESYMPDINKDDSYNRMFAYSLNEEKAEISLQAEINNLFLGYDMEGVDNHGNACTVNGVETSRGYVFFSGRDDVTKAKMKNGRILPLNCLVDEHGKIIKDKDGKIQSAKVINKDGEFSAVVSGTALTTKDMDKNLKAALKHILGDLDDNAKGLVLKALDKHCREDANQITNALLHDKDKMQRLRSETDAEHITQDLKYIMEKRAGLLQKAGEKKFAGMDLVRITSPQENALQLSPAMFQKHMSERN